MVSARGERVFGFFLRTSSSLWSLRRSACAGGGGAGLRTQPGTAVQALGGNTSSSSLTYGKRQGERRMTKHSLYKQNSYMLLM